MNMGRPPCVGMVEPRISSRLDRQVAIFAVLIRHAPSRTGEIGIERRVVLIDRMMIAAGGVGLPDFDDGVRHRPFVLIEHPTDDDNALAHRLLTSFGVVREIVLSRFQLDVAEQRSGDLRQSLLDRHEPFQRPALDRRTIRYESVRWMRFPVTWIVVLNAHTSFRFLMTVDTERFLTTFEMTDVSS